MKAAVKEKRKEEIKYIHACKIWNKLSVGRLANNNKKKMIAYGIEYKFCIVMVSESANEFKTSNVLFMGKCQQPRHVRCRWWKNLWLKVILLSRYMVYGMYDVSAVRKLPIYSGILTIPHSIKLHDIVKMKWNFMLWFVYKKKILVMLWKLIKYENVNKVSPY